MSSWKLRGKKSRANLAEAPRGRSRSGSQTSQSRERGLVVGSMTSPNFAEGLIPPPALFGSAGRAWPPRTSSAAGAGDRPTTASGAGLTPSWAASPTLPPPIGHYRPATPDRPLPRSLTGLDVPARRMPPLSPMTIGTFGENPRPAPPPPQRASELSQGQEASQQGEEASESSRQASRRPAPAPRRKMSMPALPSFFSRKKKGKDKDKEDDIF